ncbi:SpoIIE family protein phosphatase [Kitasatospora sp. CB01950]|uniref:SpoIIE family protein phosphatase n=1 Tax=Kitasatospora sp. CB01950 TaxID=1703930 RepID=UPI00093E6F46|nr:SpoIIE family protein phosphatase [Kitasatospora sp. CB01950]
MTLEPRGGGPEVAAFTAFLEQLFQALGISLTRYAARCNRDKGSVSRYFSGARIAPKDFVDELLRQVAETTGESVTPEVQEHVHRLRMAALQVRNASRHEVEELRDRLGAAERDLQLAGVRERYLLRSLEATEAQAHQAEQRYRQLEADRAAARYGAGPGELERWADGPETEHAREELRELRRELDLLRTELARAQELRHDAEDQCVRLEARLLAAEAALATQRARHERELRYRAELESPAAVLGREFARKVGTKPDLLATATELCEVFVPGWATSAKVFLRSAYLGVPGQDTSLMAFQSGDDEFDNPGRLFGEARRVLRDGVPSLASVPGELDEELVHSTLTLPLSVRGEVFGALQFVREPGRLPFERADIELLSGLAERGALLLDSARLYQAEGRLASALQRSMIPTEPPRIPGTRIAHRYLPGDGEAGAGGDWFDAIQLPGSRVALVIGDVMGHGLPAAQAMSRLRAGVQAFAALDLPPGQLLRHLDNLAHTLGDDHLATCLYAVYDPINRTCEVASAGHTPPVLVHRDGRGELLPVPPGAPIGVGGIPFVPQKLTVPDGSMLVMCSDSLVDGLAELCGELIGPADDPDDACTLLLGALPDRRDDVALLAARLDGIPQDRVAAFVVPLHPTAVRMVRRWVRARLEQWGLDHLSFTAELLAGELVTNAQRVAHLPIDLQLVCTDRLLIEVCDDDHELPALNDDDPLADSGRGLLLVSRLADRWGASRKTVGKVVWFELGVGRDQ